MSTYPLQSPLLLTAVYKEDKWSYQIPATKSQPEVTLNRSDIIEVQATVGSDAKMTVAVGSGFVLKGDPLEFASSSNTSSSPPPDGWNAEWKNSITYTMYDIHSEDFDESAAVTVKVRGVNESGDGTPVDPTFKLKRTTGTDSPP